MNNPLPQFRPDGWPRRQDTSLYTEEERQLLALVHRVESLGASPMLTECVIALGDARNRLADHLEGVETLPDEQDEVETLVSLLTEVVESLTVDDDECVHVLREPEPGNPNPTAPALPDDLWCRIRKVIES